MSTSCFKFDPQSSGIDFIAASGKAKRVFLELLQEHNENGQNVNQNGGSTYAPTVFANHQNNEGVTKGSLTTAMKSLLHVSKIISRKTARGTKLMVIRIFSCHPVKILGGGSGLDLVPNKKDLIKEKLNG